MPKLVDLIKDQGKNALIVLVCVVAIVIVTYLSGVADKPLRWLNGPTIAATSMSGDEVSGFLAGQPIRFSLQGASPDTVFWIFEEKDVQLGNVQNDHAFPFDSKAGTGIESKRRVDVFFKEGADYHVVSKHVTVRNVQIASAKIEGSTISLSVSPPPHSDWTLSKVSLGKFQDGIFRASSNVDYVVPSNDKSDPSKKLVILEQSLLGRLGVTFGQGSDPETAKGVTAYFDFENPSGKKLRTVEDLSPQIKELQAAPEPRQ